MNSISVTDSCASVLPPLLSLIPLLFPMSLLSVVSVSSSTHPLGSCFSSFLFHFRAPLQNRLLPERSPWAVSVIRMLLFLTPCPLTGYCSPFCAFSPKKSKKCLFTAYFSRTLTSNRGGILSSASTVFKTTTRVMQNKLYWTKIMRFA